MHENLSTPFTFSLRREGGGKRVVECASLLSLSLLLALLALLVRAARAAAAPPRNKHLVVRIGDPVSKVIVWIVGPEKKNIRPALTRLVDKAVGWSVAIGSTLVESFVKRSFSCAGKLPKVIAIVATRA